MYLLLKRILFIFRERGREVERERERNINVWLLLMCPRLGIWPAAHKILYVENSIDSTKKTTRPNEFGKVVGYKINT